MQLAIQTWEHLLPKGGFQTLDRRGPAEKAWRERHENIMSFIITNLKGYSGVSLIRGHSSPLTNQPCSLWGSPDESITERSRVPQLKDETVWLLLNGNAIKIHICLTYQFITVIIKSWQGKEQNWAFLTALGCRLVRSSPQQGAAAGEWWVVFTIQ